MFPFGSGLFQKSFEGSLCSLLDGLENSSAENDKKYSQKVLPFLAEKFLILGQKSKIFCPVDFLFPGNVFAPMGEAVDFSRGLPFGRAACGVSGICRVITIFARDILQRTTEDRDD
ncbi:hypothetical protein [Porphyromonas endodontalis]|uniref:hypothetical protein n=1 Tax=Porphyromonas endodontalis TaxID=28124 RepID=UPI0028F09913|nr:hypothetical protein [Porphyromonas endodontalis]